MPIDVHAHYVPPLLIDTLEARASEFRLSVVKHPPSCSCALHFDYGLKVRPFFPKLIEPVAHRLEAMARQGVDRQVLSMWADIFAHGLPREVAQKWHRHLNEHLAKVCQEHHRTFSMLASVPFPYAQEAAAELEHAVQNLGAVGAVVAANLEGINLGELDLDAFWQLAEDLDVAVFIHPVQAVPMPRAGKFALAQIVQYTVDTSFTVGSLIRRRARPLSPFACAALARRWHVPIPDRPFRLHARAHGSRPTGRRRPERAIHLSASVLLRHDPARSEHSAMVGRARLRRPHRAWQRLFVSAGRS
jgi:Amidohydrolase